MIDVVDHVMRDGGLFLRRWFGSADIHVTIDLHGIGPHDLAPDALGQANRGGCFADAGRTADDDDAGASRIRAHAAQIIRLWA